MPVDLGKLAAVRAAQIQLERLVAERTQLRIERANANTQVDIRTAQILIAKSDLEAAKVALTADLANSEPLPP